MNFKSKNQLSVLIVLSMGLVAILFYHFLNKGSINLRAPAAQVEEEAQKSALVYLTYGEPMQVEKYSQEIYQNLQPQARLALLTKMYYANTREVSNSGLKHASCFIGNASEISQSFLNKSLGDRIIEGSHKIKISSDESSLRLSFSMKAARKKSERYDFILENCFSGKSPIYIEKDTDFGKYQVQKRQVSSVERPALQDSTPFPKDGFVTNDKLAENAELPAGVDRTSLPLFKLKADFDRVQIKKGDRPWQGMNLLNEAGEISAKEAIKLGIIAQRYFYEGMADQNKNIPDQNFIAQNSKKRYWCHMPWLNVGVSGREAIHGLTKERDLVPSPFIDLYKQTTPGTDWGVGFYNSYACQNLGEIFGSEAKPNAVPDFKKVNFPDGSFTSKILFTTAEMDMLKEAYTWNAHATEPGSNFRSLKKVKHIQMDIAIKDSSIKGTDKDVNHWIMFTYYFDPSYDMAEYYKNEVGEPLPYSKLVLAPGLEKMRLQGIQFGLEKEHNIIFKGAQTNNVESRLNGPADNHQTSCMNCHAMAGMSMRMVPGVMLNSKFAEYSAKGKTLDFSHQLALAKKNFELVMGVNPR